MHYERKDLTWEDVGNGWTRAIVTLGKGDSAFNPSSTKEGREIWGPALVTYEQSRMSLSAYVEDVPTA